MFTILILKKKSTARTAEIILIECGVEGAAFSYKEKNNLPPDFARDFVLSWGFKTEKIGKNRRNSYGYHIRQAHEGFLRDRHACHF